MGEEADRIVNRMMFGRPKRRYRKVWDEDPRSGFTDEQHAEIRREAAEAALDAALDEDEEGRH